MSSADSSVGVDYFLEALDERAGMANRSAMLAMPYVAPARSKWDLGGDDIHAIRHENRYGSRRCVVNVNSRTNNSAVQINMAGVGAGVTPLFL